MKIRSVAAGLVLVLALVAACARDTTPDSGEKATSASPSPTVGQETHVFEGEGKDDKYVKSDSVELYGQYSVEWEVSGNKLEHVDNPAMFDAELKSENDSVTVIIKDVEDGSGTEKLQIDKPEEYYAHVFSVSGARWKLTLTRTCAGVPPQCDPIPAR